MTDDELDRHLRDIIHGLRVDAVPTESALDRLRQVVEGAERAEFIRVQDRWCDRCRAAELLAKGGTGS